MAVMFSTEIKFYLLDFRNHSVPFCPVPLRSFEVRIKVSYLYLKVRNGHIKRITDGDIQSLVLEIVGTNVR